MASSGSVTAAVNTGPGGHVPWEYQVGLVTQTGTGAPVADDWHWVIRATNWGGLFGGGVGVGFGVGRGVGRGVGVGVGVGFGVGFGVGLGVAEGVAEGEDEGGAE